MQLPNLTKSLVGVKDKVGKLRADHWAWLHAKCALIVWSILFFAFTPVKVAQALAYLLSTTISIVTTVGVLVSVVGLLIANSDNIATARRGADIELSGLWIAITGPLSYFVTQFFLTFGPDGDQRIALTAFAYTLCSFMFVRIIIIRSHRKRTRV